MGLVLLALLASLVAARHAWQRTARALVALNTSPAPTTQLDVTAGLAAAAGALVGLAVWDGQGRSWAAVAACVAWTVALGTDLVREARGAVPSAPRFSRRTERVAAIALGLGGVPVVAGSLATIPAYGPDGVLPLLAGWLFASLAAPLWVGLADRLVPDDDPADDAEAEAAGAPDEPVDAADRLLGDVAPVPAATAEPMLDWEDLASVPVREALPVHVPEAPAEAVPVPPSLSEAPDAAEAAPDDPDARWKPRPPDDVPPPGDASGGSGR